MKKYTYLTIVLAAISAVSCLKEKELHPAGTKIVFTAATEYRNGTETRTVYSGDYTGTTTNYERIDWDNDDQITILYYHGNSESSNYDIRSIDPPTSHARKSTATVSVASGSSSLEWADTGPHMFFGLYPSLISGRTFTTTTVDQNPVGRITGLTVPYKQYVKYDSSQDKYLPEDMDYAYMVAYKDMTSDAEQAVDLPFSPVVTAVEFRLHLPNDKPSYSVSKVELKSSTALAGSYSVDITGYDTNNGCVTWNAHSFAANTTNPNVIVEFKNASGTAVTPDLPDQATSPTPQTYLNFTMFVLPRTITNPELLIKYTDSNNPQTQTIKKITLSGLQLDPGRKYLVYNTQAGYDKFGFTVLPNGTNPPQGNTVSGHDGHTWSNIQVTSTKTSGADPTHVETLNWKVQYYDNNNSRWYDGVPIADGYTLTEDHTHNRFTVQLSGTAPTTTDNTKKAFTAAKEILQSRTELGTENNPYDLSTHDLAGEPMGQTAANCYVVTAPGWYKFPLIYGNAVVGGFPNEDAYYPTHNSNVSWTSGTTVGSDDDDQNYYLPQFYNAAGDVIDSPYILEDLSHLFGKNATLYTITAFDANGRGTSGTPGPPTVHLDNNNGAALNPGIITNYTVVASSSTDQNAYVKFYVSPSNIKPGNTRLLLKGGIGSDPGAGGISYADNWPVFWSWHIWVTDKDLTDFDTANDNSVMPYNLGWVDNDAIYEDAVQVYAERELELRIAQVEGGTIQNNRVVGGTEVNYGSSFFLTETAGEVISVEYVSPTQGTNPHYQWGRKDPFAYDGTPVAFVQHNDTGEASGYNTFYTNTYWYWRGIRIPEVMLASEKSRTWMDGKAYPLYEVTGQAPSGYTVSSGRYGPFTATQKSTISRILGDSGWGQRKEVYNNSTFTQYFSPSIYTWSGSPCYTGIPQSSWRYTVLLNAYYYYYLPDGTVLTCFQQNDLRTCCNTAGGARNDALGVNVDNYSNFDTYNLRGIDAYDLNLENDVTITETQKNSLISAGFPNSFTTNYSNTYGYTSDSDRNLGSILYNLWSAYRYNEKSADAPSSGDKMKTVYDPCPPGFTVPTIETYLGSTSMGSTKTANATSGFGDYPLTGARIDNGSSSLDLTKSNAGTTGYYWTDRPCNMVLTGNNKASINSYSYYYESYMMKTGSTPSVEHASRATAASIRPMVDVGSGIYTVVSSPSPGNVGSSIEGLSNGNNLY